jgi:hypothetical protein
MLCDGREGLYSNFYKHFKVLEEEYYGVRVVIIYEAVGRSDPVRYERGIMRDDDDDGHMVSLTESLNLPTSCMLLFRTVLISLQS